MRYKAYTEDDLEFLWTHIAGNQPDTPKLAQKHFRNVSIIAAWNAHKDQINKVGSERFAKETGQTLTTFYSKDQWAEDDEYCKQKRWKKQSIKNPRQKSNSLSPALQRALQELPHGSTEHIPGKC
jgi:translation initiation factor 2B subunit (eIF-2B alpha/beta/delta family)